MGRGFTTGRCFRVYSSPSPVLLSGVAIWPNFRLHNSKGADFLLVKYLPEGAERGPKKVFSYFLPLRSCQNFLPAAELFDDLAELFYQELATLLLSCWAVFVRIGF
jgi:hypothetical protein